MNKGVIVSLIVILIGVIVVITSSKDVSTYASIQDAKSGNLVKIAGQLSKDKPMEYDAENNPNQFVFFMHDQKGGEVKVVLNKPKPQDFEMSEQIVVTGRMTNDVFSATDILMKCPSKYKNEEISIKDQNG
ncbi:MAG: cytochrome c maturation protein CcmE [Saprospiraceae bacterium]|nr:cytochrome c maturation protein CcmE [Saprospiraceae bacterium]MCB9310558.1 cytochrome c maturation protein CcmE [Lewinellaceae bacterium]